jgi:hypothetical protein
VEDDLGERIRRAYETNPITLEEVLYRSEQRLYEADNCLVRCVRTMAENVRTRWRGEP